MNQRTIIVLSMVAVLCFMLPQVAAARSCLPASGPTANTSNIVSSCGKCPPCSASVAYLVSLNPPTPENNYQVQVTLNSSFPYNQFRTDGGNIRFSTTTGTQLPFWIESWNQAPANTSIVWVKVPVAGTSLIELTSASTSAPSQSNGTAVFDYFDDFSTGLGNWNVIQQAFCTVSLVNGMVQLQANIDDENCLANVFQGISDTYTLEGQTFGTYVNNGLLVIGNGLDSITTPPGAINGTGQGPVNIDYAWSVTDYARIDANNSRITTTINGTPSQFSWASPLYIATGILPINFLARSVFYGPGDHYAAQIVSKEGFGLGQALLASTFTNYTYTLAPYSSGAALIIAWAAIRKCSLVEPAATLLNLATVEVMLKNAVEASPSSAWRSAHDKTVMLSKVDQLSCFLNFRLYCVAYSFLLHDIEPKLVEKWVVDPAWQAQFGTLCTILLQEIKLLESTC